MNLSERELSVRELSVRELKEGVRRLERGWACLDCGRVFPDGEVFSMDGRFWDAEHAVSLHAKREHPSRFTELLHDEKKVNLTANQRQFLALVHEGHPDNEIARRMGVSPSTVRHQKFTLREKCRQARAFLALCELAFERKPPEPEELLPIPEGAKMADERFDVTAAERDKVFETAFASLEPLRLRLFPVKEKKKIVVLGRLAEEFSRGRRYTENEVNDILREIYPDYVTLRRYLIEYGFLSRTADCKVYWKK